MASKWRYVAFLALFLLIYVVNLFGPKWDFKTTPNHFHLSSPQVHKRTHTRFELMGNNNTLGNVSNNLATNSSSFNATDSNNKLSEPNVGKVIVKLDSSSSTIIINSLSSITENITENSIREKVISTEKENHTLSTNNMTEMVAKAWRVNACPPIPPNLDGPIEVDTNYEPLLEVEKRFASKLQPGGWYYPKECNAKDRVAIIVPYRDRDQHIPIFLKNLHLFLMKQQIRYGIFIVEQAEGALFNRASLMNIGFTEALKLENWDCFVFHDIDLLPMDDRNLYTCPDQPRHMSVAVDTFGFKLPYKSIFGGVSAMSVKEFKAVNGFSNSFWGWGGEDDDMSNRLKHVGFHIARYPVNIARYTMLSHKKEKANPKRYEKLVAGTKKFDSDGLNSLNYNLIKMEKKPLYTWIYVEIKQDKIWNEIDNNQYAKVRKIINLVQSEKKAMKSQTALATAYQQNENLAEDEEEQSNRSEIKINEDAGSEVRYEEEAIHDDEKSSRKFDRNVFIVAIIIITALVSETLLKPMLYIFDQGRKCMEKQIIRLWNEYLVTNLDLNFEKLIKLLLVIPVVIICVFMYFVVTLIYYMIKLFLMKI